MYMHTSIHISVNIYIVYIHTLSDSNKPCEHFCDVFYYSVLLTFPGRFFHYFQVKVCFVFQPFCLRLPHKPERCVDNFYMSTLKRRLNVGNFETNPRTFHYVYFPCSQDGLLYRVSRNIFVTFSASGKPT